MTIQTRVKACDSLAELLSSARRAIVPAETVLDIGCGIIPESYVKPSRLHILAEPYGEYVDILRQKFGQDPRYFIMQGKGIEVTQHFLDRSVDSVFCLDVIEHLPKVDGLRLIEELDRVARRQVVILTPVGFMPQEGDVWGYHGHEVQRHLSAWQPEDFDANWRVLTCDRMHIENGWGEKFDPPKGGMFAIKTKYVTPDFVYWQNYSARFVWGNFDKVATSIFKRFGR